MRTNETIAINAKLEIVKLNNQKFKVPGGYAVKKGYAFYHPQLGYFSFGDEDKDGHILPYTPCGGKKALKSILDEGGLLSFEGCVWIKEIA